MLSIPGLPLSFRRRAFLGLARSLSSQTPPTPPAALPVLTLYTKDPCPLCDRAKERLRPFQGQFRLEEVDITEPEHAHWFELYRYEIPVFHFQREFLCRNRIDTKLLQKALDEYSAQMTQSSS